MAFYFKQSTREVCVRELLISLVIFFLLVALGVALVRSMFGYNSSNSGLVLLFCIWCGTPWLKDFYSRITWVIKAVKCGGIWNIKVTDSEIVWKAPSYAEKNFRIGISEISKVLKIGSELHETRVSYFIETINGDIISLFSGSSINMDLFVENLTGIGVKYKHIERYNDKVVMDFRKKQIN